MSTEVQTPTSSQHDAKLLVSRSPIYGIFRFDDKGYVGYWTDYEAGKKVFEEEYDNGEWYYDEMVCQDCGNVKAYPQWGN